ncbi:MAG: hypothetical protein ACWA44_00760 [Thiotrichales bacterium]
MNQMVEATIDEDGKVQLKESISLNEKHKALVIILDEPEERPAETALLSEAVLAHDWDREEEDEAWKAYQ